MRELASTCPLEVCHAVVLHTEKPVRFGAGRDEAAQNASYKPLGFPLRI